MKGDTKVYTKGASTDPDVDRLMEVIPVEQLEANATVTREQVADAIGEPVGSYRYRTVVNAWRKALEAHPRRIYFGTRRNIGWCVLSDSGHLREGVGRQRRAVRAIDRSAVHLRQITAARLSDDERTVYGHAQKFAALFTAEQLQKSGAELPKLTQ